ncbi:MAG: response regulator, partial [Proteobacteria bacterium]|nr:response regulator [Pseudomonadota bacterium]
MANAPSSTVKILLADDSVTMHRAVALGLKKEPFEIIYCDNGQDALRLARQHRPIIVLADLDMPGMTGAELCQAIKNDPDLSRETKVILLCGSFDQIDETKIEHIPADARLWKPFESHVLVSMLHTLLKIPPKIPQEATLYQSRPNESTVAINRPSQKIEKTFDAMSVKQPIHETAWQSQSTSAIPTAATSVQIPMEKTAAQTRVMAPPPPPPPPPP